jgi:uncharacterized protein
VRLCGKVALAFNVTTNNLARAIFVSTIILVEISFDPAKSERNETDRNLPFTLVEQLDWSGAIIEEDVRKNYGERRYRVLGLIGDRLHTIVFTPRADKVHVISLRKANQREVKRYVENT